MKRFVFLLFVLFLIVLAAEAKARDKLLNIDLSQDRVNITTGFTGSDISLFGVKSGRGEVVIILEGPSKNSTVRRKERIFGAWVNRTWIDFTSVPLYYDYATNVDANHKIMSLDRRQKSHVGVEALVLKPDDEGHDKETLKAFHEALIRNKQSRELYPIKPEKITFLDDRFFRVDFHLPANVPRGQYMVRGLLIRDGKVIEEVAKEMKVAQIGLSSNINKLAEKHSFAYGLICVFIALVAGVLSDILVRRH